jgi:hypothetical protein
MKETFHDLRYDSAILTGGRVTSTMEQNVFRHCRSITFQCCETDLSMIARNFLEPFTTPFRKLLNVFGAASVISFWAL